MSEIKVFKLVTNEDIIGEVSKETDDIITIVNIVKLVVSPSRENPGEYSYGYVPYPAFAQPLSDTPIHITKSNIVFTTELDQQFLDQYNEIFRKIVAPTSKLILK